MRDDDSTARVCAPAHVGMGSSGEPVPLDIAHVLGSTVRRFRRRREWSLQKLAERARLSYQFLSEVETGKRNFSIVTLAKLSQALGVPVVAMVMEAYGVAQTVAAPGIAKAA